MIRILRWIGRAVRNSSNSASAKSPPPQPTSHQPEVSQPEPDRIRSQSAESPEEAPEAELPEAYPPSTDSSWQEPSPPKVIRTLETFPIEIILEIAKHFPPETRAVLALCSRTMFARLGTRSFDLHASAKYQLLLLLEKDGWYLPNILCADCCIFHSITPFWSLPNRARRCRTLFPLVREETKSRLLSLPSVPHFNLVASVMRPFRFNLWNSCVVAPFLHSSSFDCNDLKDCRVRCSYRTRIVGDHLLLKSQSLVLPCKDRTKLLESVPTATQMLQRHPWELDHCCVHVTWTRRYAYVLPPQGQNVSSTRSRHRCFWLHPSSCNICDNDTGAFLVHSCRSCYTDYSLGFVDPPGNSGVRVCVLTSWKDLGPGRSPDDPEWASHSLHQDGSTVTPRKAGAMEIHRNFENISGNVGAARFYPIIQRELLEGLAGA